MSYSSSYSNYLGAQRCCNTNSAGPQGSQGSMGVAGPIGFRGATGAQGSTGPSGGAQGSTGATGAQGATGPSQWISMNGVGVTGGGYTGIGVTGQDVLIYGNLLVTGGIDPTYLALTPQASGPTGFVNPLWVDSINGNALRSQNIYMDNTSGTGNTGAYISLIPDSTNQIILNDGGATAFSNTINYSSMTISDTLNTLTIDQTNITHSGATGPLTITGNNAINLNGDSIQMTTTGNNIGFSSGTSVNITATDGVYLTASNDPMTLTSASLMTITGNDGLTMTANNNPMTLTCNGASISMTASDDIGLTTATDAINLNAGLGINLNALNVNSYNYAMPICFDLVETSTINYTLVGQQMELVYQGKFNLPYQFFSDTPLVSYTSTKWKIDFQINCYNSSGGQGDKGFASYIDFEDQSTNLYTPFLFNATTPFARFFNNSSYNQASPLLFSWGWSDYVDFGGLVGTGSGNLPLNVNLYVAGDGALTGDFKWKVSLTRTNGV